MKKVKTMFFEFIIFYPDVLWIENIEREKEGKTKRRREFLDRDKSFEYSGEVLVRFTANEVVQKLFHF